MLPVPGTCRFTARLVRDQHGLIYCQERPRAHDMQHCVVCHGLFLFLLMTQRFLDWLCSLIAAGDVHPFYVSPEWRELSRAVLSDDHWNCQICGRPGAAVMVHHVKHVKLFPALALSRCFIDKAGNRHRNLISVCRGCHENVCHPERLRRRPAAGQAFVTEERWD